MIRIARHRAAKRPGLVAMIDVIFLLIVFFMVAARLDQQQSLAITLAGQSGAEWEGPPRLVEVGAGTTWLNGVPVAPADLSLALAPLMPTQDAPVIALPRADATVADIAAVIGALRAEGINQVVLAQRSTP